VGAGVLAGVLVGLLGSDLIRDLKRTQKEMMGAWERSERSCTREALRWLEHRAFQQLPRLIGTGYCRATLRSTEKRALFELEGQEKPDSSSRYCRRTHRRVTLKTFTVEESSGKCEELRRVQDDEFWHRLECLGEPGGRSAEGCVQSDYRHSSIQTMHPLTTRQLKPRRRLMTVGLSGAIH
jgi:hypothetical protein